MKNDNSYPREFEVCILAGGRSRRMGTDKRLLLLNGVRFLDKAESLASSVSPHTRLIMKDSRPGCGPLGGVLTALETSQLEGCVFIPVDMPFLTETSLRAFCRSWTDHSKPHFTRHEARLGFPFAVATSWISTITGFLEAGEFSLAHFAEVTKSSWIDSGRLGPEKEFSNINTMEDFMNHAQ